MPLDPISQGLDIPDHETAIQRLERLQANILRLRDDIPNMHVKAKMLQQYLSGLTEDLGSAMACIDELMERQTTWLEWLSDRLTLMANLKYYLEMVNHDDIDESPEENVAEPEGDESV